jgi:alpha/beta superfamily hydrolase
LVAIRLESPAGVLVGLHDPPLGNPAEAGPRAAVVCHPHPTHGGTMDTKVVYATAKALASEGLHVVRFNFRGTAGSEGRHDRGRGEVEDARAALDLAATLVEGADVPGGLLMAGFSFGSFVGLSAALDDPRVAASLAIAPPVNHYDYSAIAASGLPLGVIYARDDELVPPDEVEAWVAGCAQPPRVWVADGGGGHLFHGQLSVIRGAVSDLLVSLR